MADVSDAVVLSPEMALHVIYGQNVTSLAGESATTTIIAMANLAQQFVREITAPRAWFLLLLFPLFVLLARRSVATLLSSAGKLERTKKQRQDEYHRRLPPSPPVLPVIGHLHLVGSVPHVSLRALARKHGYDDLMMLRLGAMPVLVVSSPRAAEAVLRTHDHVFASRARSLATEVVLYGPSDIGFVPYGDNWRQARKLVTTHLLSSRKVQAFRLAREEEVGVVMSRIREAAAAGAAVDVGELLRSFTNDLACRVVMGKSFRSEGRNTLFRELVTDTSPLLGGFNLEEFFPFLARFGVLSKVVRTKSERVRRRWDELLDGLIRDHENKHHDRSATASDDTKEDDFIHVLLSVRDEYGLTGDQMKAILLDVFFGAIDTEASLLEFTIVELMRRPDAMRKLRDEVRGTVPKEQEFVTEADQSNMAYLKAVIKESLRLHPVAPLLAPHLSMSVCDIIDGFVVPAGIRVLVNAWAIGRDARLWGDDAEAFVPERFLDGGAAADVSFRGNDFRFLPFGAGRRMCPGMNFALATVELMLANLVLHFDLELPEGKERHDIDMSEVFGLVVHRKKKLHVVPKLQA